MYYGKSESQIFPLQGEAGLRKWTHQQWAERGWQMIQQASQDAAVAWLGAPLPALEAGLPSAVRPAVFKACTDDVLSNLVQKILKALVKILDQKNNGIDLSCPQCTGMMRYCGTRD